MAELVILVGPPGSGKSTLAKSEFAGHAYVNQDSQGKDGYRKAFNEALDRKDSIIVDRMNFSEEQRRPFLEAARANGYSTKIIVLHEPRQVCLDRCLARENHETIKDQRSANSALNTFFSKYERPQQKEANEIEFRYPPGHKISAIICDLDGTLCNIDHRLQYVKQKPKDWKGFFEGIQNDTPNMWCYLLVDAFKNKKALVFASGRSDDYMKATKEWLEKYGLPTNRLYMRCRGDFRQDYIAKEIILDFEILTRYEPIFFIDDRQQVVDLWRRRGFVALQCSEGDF